MALFIAIRATPLLAFFARFLFSGKQADWLNPNIRATQVLANAMLDMQYCTADSMENPAPARI